jgi:acetyl-CoA acetyltransferase
MAFPRRKAAIVGLYTTRQGKIPDRTSFSLQLGAIKGALADAGLTTADIDGLLPMSGTEHLPGTAAHQFWAEQLSERPLSLVETGGASGMLAKAATAIASGLINVPVLFFGRAASRCTCSTARSTRTAGTRS